MKIICWLGCLLMATLVSSAGAAEFLNNGNFEQGLKDWSWKAYGGAKATCRADFTPGCEGTRAICLVSQSDTAPSVSGVLSQIASGLRPNTSYKLIASFKGKQIGPAWILGGPGWDVRGYFWLGDVDDWQTIEVPFKTGDNQTTYDVMIAVDGKTQSLWVDNIRIVDASAEAVDQAQAALQRLVIESSKWMNVVSTKGAPLAALTANLDESRKLLQRLAQQKTQLAQAKKSMPASEQQKWIDELTGARQRSDGVVIWTQDAMKDLRPVSMPESLTGVETIQWTACRNEHAPVVVNITNLLGGPVLDVRVALAAFVPMGQAQSAAHRVGDWNPRELGTHYAYLGSQGHIPAAQIVLREAVPIRKSTGDWTTDPLSKLDQSRRLSVPVGETRQLWLDVDTAGLAPGKYQAFLDLIPTDVHRPQATRRVRLELEILPLELPKTMPISVLNFDYGLTSNAHCLQDLLDHRVNVFHVPIGMAIPAEVNTKTFEFLSRYVAIARKHNAMLMIENANLAKTGWKPEYEAYFRGMFKYFRDAGLRDDQVLMHLYDEHLGPDFLAAAKALKAIDPKVMIIANPFRTDYTEQIYMDFMPYIDVWCPKLGLINHWSQNQPRVLETITRNGKRLWLYDCNSGKSNETSMANRTLPWTAYKYQLQGIGAWTYCTTDYANPWDDKLSLDKVYPLADGSTVPSRRWEAWREGLEDYCLLAALKERIRAKANKTLSDDQYRQAQSTLDDAVKVVNENTQDADVLAQQRVRLLDIARLLTQ